MRVRRKPAVSAAVALVLGGVLALANLPAGAATGDEEGSGGSAATCEASDGEIYQPPSEVPGTPGEVLSCHETTLPHVPGNIAMTAWKVQYSSTDNAGKPIAVSGTVAVPDKEWDGPGERPIVAFNPGTLGLGSQCAFSKQLAGEYQDMYEGDNIAEALKAGNAVAATDGVGYLDGQVHPYVSGADAGHAVLDLARAAPAVPESGLNDRAKVGIWGYSEGGAASLWAAQLAKEYAPELDVAGVASGGIPGDLKVTAEALNGSAFAGFLADAVVGLSTSHPNLPFDELMNDKGKEAVAKTQEHCLTGTLAGFPFEKIENLTEEGYSLDELYELAGDDGKTWGEVVDEQKLGVDVGPAGSGARHELDFPVLQYRALADEVIPTETEDATHEAYCKAGVPTRWKTYPGEHLTADNMAVGDSVEWLNARFAGEEEPGDC